jgi:hypothetical protein
MPAMSMLPQQKKTMTRYTANGMLPAQCLHKACTKHKRKHFHETIQVSLFTHNGTWFHISTNIRGNRSCRELFKSGLNLKKLKND